jgi:mono/diheme cytochrome c family protein
VFTLSACGGGSDREGEVITSDQGPVPTATEPGAKSTTPPSTGIVGSGAETNEGDGAGPDPDPSQGEEIFAAAGCGDCHTLAAAGATGENAPNLDEAEPGFDDAVDQITNGGGGMPPFKGELSAREIEDVAAFVVEASKG